jgi:hypothetical protein
MWAIAAVLRSGLGLVAFFFLFGMGVAVMDRGGGRSGAKAGSRVTVGQRVIEGGVQGEIGASLLFAAVFAGRSKREAS